jgi:hypothetical protein
MGGWLDKVPLKISYHELFMICGDHRVWWLIW